MIFDDVERLSGAGPTGAGGTGSSTGGGGLQLSKPIVPKIPAPPAPSPPPSVHAAEDESSPTLVENVPHIPSKPPPPKPPAAARWILGNFAWLAVGGVLLLGCPPTPNLPDAADVAGHYASQSQCLGASDAGDAVTWKAAVDACRAQDFKVWCLRWPAAIDCAPDAGRFSNEGGDSQ